MEEGKKLPATWKSVARLEEEEIKELDRLEKLRKEIAVLEDECYAEYRSEDGGDSDEDDREVFVLA
jgi:predicted GNAT family N-acyltransferase